MNPRSRYEQLWLRSVPISRACSYIASALVAATYFYHLARGSTAYLGLLEDDFFYYLEVADNIAKTGRLSYDTITLTNGFHPLWLVVLLGLRLLIGSVGPAFFAALASVLFGAMIATYELGRRFAQALGASPPLAAAIAALYSLGNARLAASGMECVVAVPLMLWWLTEIARNDTLTSRRAAYLGLVASLAILARLDIALLVAIAIVGYVLVVRPPVKLLVRQLLAFCCGGILLALYALANFVFFGTPLPVSALAKRLIIAPGFSLAYGWNAAFGSYFGPTAGVVLAFGSVATAYLAWRRREMGPPSAPFVAAVTLLFTFVFFLLNAQSGWIYFGWYAYPFAAALIPALVALCQWLKHARVPAALLHAVVGALVVAAPLESLRYYVEHGPRWSISDNALLAMSYNLERHVRQYDGRFGMGAIAGVAQFVLRKPVVQLEGIIADRRMVRHIQHQDDLAAVLREYGVDYLVVSMVGRSIPMTDGCYLVTEPELTWAGSRTAKMSGLLCTAPTEHFFTEGGTNPWSQFGRVETFVWDVRNAGWHSRSASSPLAATK
jgi:hypothetical protein